MSEPTYVVATIKPWNLAVFHARSPSLPGNWILIDDPIHLTLPFLHRHSPRYVLFPHWSWRVPVEVLQAYECVCFHMTDVPFGRGGSPLQNLIQRGHKETCLSALRMVPEMDAGPVYLKRHLSLDGRAQDIFERAASLTFDMIEELISRNIAPEPQKGEPVVFQRRTPAMSELPSSGSLDDLYDFIRMLDADTYPRAYLDWGDFRIEFGDAGIDGDSLSARVIVRRPGGAR